MPTDQQELSFEEKCPHCGASLEPEATNCKACGRPLAEAEADGQGKAELRYRDLVTVFRGDGKDVFVLKGKLECDGLDAFVPDEATKNLNPFLTGGGLALFHELQVPSDQVARARAILADSSPIETRPEFERQVADSTRARRLGWLAYTLPSFAFLGLAAWMLFSVPGLLAVALVLALLWIVATRGDSGAATGDPTRSDAGP